MPRLDASSAAHAAFQYQLPAQLLLVRMMTTMTIVPRQKAIRLAFGRVTQAARDRLQPFQVEQSRSLLDHRRHRRRGSWLPRQRLRHIRPLQSRRCLLLAAQARRLQRLPRRSRGVGRWRPRHHPLLQLQHLPRPRPHLRRGRRKPRVPLLLRRRRPHPLHHPRPPLRARLIALQQWWRPLLRRLLRQASP